MAAASITGTNTTDIDTATTAPVINLPASIQAGEGLLVATVHNGAATVTYPAGWDKIYEGSPHGVSDVISIGTRQATGGEGATVTLTTTSFKCGALSWRIAGAAPWATTQPEMSPDATGSGTSTVNPGAHTIAGGTKDYLFIWLGAQEGEQTMPPASNPTNYGSNIIGAGTGVAGAADTNARIFSASRTATTGSEDGGVWTTSAAGDWVAWTLAIYPAAADVTEALTGTDVVAAGAVGSLSASGGDVAQPISGFANTFLQ